jgi:CheY-like chemotaxis protein
MSRLLLVEDEERLARSLEVGLRDEGYVIDRAADGEEALWLAAARHHDGVILDLRLPKVGGLEVCRRLRDRGDPTPILVLTACDATGDVVAGLDRGADDYLKKPFEFAELLARLRALVRRGSASRGPLSATSCSRRRAGVARGREMTSPRPNSAARVPGAPRRRGAEPRPPLRRAVGRRARPRLQRPRSARLQPAAQDRPRRVAPPAPDETRCRLPPDDRRVMKRLSLRASLTAWFLGPTMLLLGGFSATLYAALARALRGGVDAELVARAEAMLGICEWDEEIDDVESASAPLAAEPDTATKRGSWLDVAGAPPAALFRRAARRGAAESRAADGATRAVAREELGRAAAPRLLMLARAPAVPAHDDDPDHPPWCTASLAGRRAARARWRGGRADRRRVARHAGVRRVFAPLRAALRELGAAAAAVRPGEYMTMPRRGRATSSTGSPDQLISVHVARRVARLTGASPRTPRTSCAIPGVVRNAAEVALRHDRTGEEYRRFLYDVRATALRMGRIVEALLQLARLDGDGARARFEVVDLTAVARAAVAATAPGALVRNGSDTSVRGQAGLLRVLVDNLLSNAREHSNGGPADIEVDVTPADGGRVALSVRDRGPGVPDAEKPPLRALLPRERRARPQRRRPRPLDRRRRRPPPRRHLPHRGRPSGHARGGRVRGGGGERAELNDGAVDLAAAPRHTSTGLHATTSSCSTACASGFTAGVASPCAASIEFVSTSASATWSGQSGWSTSPRTTRPSARFA